MKFQNLLLVSLVLLAAESTAQNYNAIHGSSYSGSLGVYNNPSSIVSTPHKWDITVIGLQYQTITNALRGPNFPFNLKRSAEFYGATGNYRRYGDVNYNVRLLNSRFALNENNAVAVGLNFRGYMQVNTSRIDYNDSIFGPRTFLAYNVPNERLDLDATTSLWMELFGTYARTIRNTETGRLNAGLTVKILKPMSGAFAEINGVGVESEVVNDQTLYKVAQGTGRYGYSENLGNLESFTGKDLFSGAKLGIAFDAGIEYIVKTQAVTDVYDEGAEHDYDLKIGFSLLDIGWNNFAYSNNSRSAAQFVEDIDSEVLREKFTTVEDVATFNDTVATIVNSFDTLSGNFKIFNPTRAVLNVDKYISGNFFVNAELSLNLTSGGKSNFAVKESKLITITPRWETSKLGFYMPVQVTRHGNFWIGGAVKAGPLLIGTHNLLNTFSKNKNVAGGAYIALTIRPVNIARNLKNQQYDCPAY